MTDPISEFLNPEDLWQRVLEKMKRKLSIPSFQTWKMPLKLNTVVKHKIVLYTPNDFIKD